MFVLKRQHSWLANSPVFQSFSVIHLWRILLVTTMIKMWTQPVINRKKEVKKSMFTYWTSFRPFIYFSAVLSNLPRNLGAWSAPKNMFSWRYFGKPSNTSSEPGLWGLGLYSISSNSLSCVNLNCRPEWINGIKTE